MRIVLGLVLVSACTIDTGNAESDLVLTRDDGTRIQLPPNTETRADCEPATPYRAATVEIFHGNPLGGSSWTVSAVLADVSRGEPVTFPTASGALVLVEDEEDDNDAASDQPDSTGTITFQSADCDGFMEFSIHAALDSEYGGPAITVQGSFRTPIGEPR